MGSCDKSKLLATVADFPAAYPLVWSFFFLEPTYFFKDLELFYALYRASGSLWLDVAPQDRLHSQLLR